MTESTTVSGELLPAAEPEPTRKERRLGMLFSGIAFFAGYVLTAGPAVFLARTFDTPMMGAIVKVLYAPLVLTVKLRIPLIAPAIEAWVELFR